MRLIDADALKGECYITVRGTTIGKNNYVMFHEIDNAPIIDAVQVVRCKDCANCLHYDDETESEWLWCTINTRPTAEEDFCSFGERKGGEDE